MYQVVCDGNVVGNFDELVYIRLSQNGSYVPCDESIADGVCVKLPRQVETEIEDETTGEVTTETRIVYEDTVFRLKENALTGDEQLCVVTKTD